MWPPSSKSTISSAVFDAGLRTMATVPNSPVAWLARIGSGEFERQSLSAFARVILRLDAASSPERVSALHLLAS